MSWEEEKGDLISRSELIKALEPYKFAICGFEGVLALIDKAPAVEYTFEEAFQKTICENKLYCPARPKGEWIITGEKQGAFGITYKIRKCDKCGWEHSLVIPDNFCPRCGAKMLKGGAEE